MFGLPFDNVMMNQMMMNQMMNNPMMMEQLQKQSAAASGLPSPTAKPKIELTSTHHYCSIIIDHFKYFYCNPTTKIGVMTMTYTMGKAQLIDFECTHCAFAKIESYLQKPPALIKHSLLCFARYQKKIII